MGLLIKESSQCIFFSSLKSLDLQDAMPLGNVFLGELVFKESNLKLLVSNM